MAVRAILLSNPDELVVGPCFHCRKGSTIPMTAYDIVSYGAWRTGSHIQTAFHHWPADKRELLISGIHPECWGPYLGPEDDE